MKLNSDSEITQSIIDEIPTSKLEYHKELLFGLFLFAEEEDPEGPDIPTEIVNPKKRFLSQSEYAVETMKSDSLLKSRQMATPLSSLPELLRSFSMLEKYEIEKNNDPAFLSENNDDNDLSSSVDLKEIESIGMKKFHKHIFPKLSSPINQINQYHKIPCRKELQFSSSNNEVMKNKAVLDNQMLDSLSSTPTFSSFSIKFNECSLFAISHWAVKSSIPNDSEEIRDEVTRQYYPAPDVKLRKCNICNLWGHYDIECGKMAKADVFYFSNALQNQSTKPLAYNKHSRDKQTINLKEPCVDSTNIESCGKFFLEQSKNMLPIDSGYLNYVNDSESCNGSELVETQGRIDNSNLSQDQNSLSPNNLCWAKRGNAVAGSLGKDKWWPGMIIYAFDSGNSNRNQEQDRSSFVVRFFCCQGGGRVRATEVIPFFPNFDLIWNDRLSHPDEPDYEFFIKALKEASNASNSSFPTDPSTQKTKKRKYKRSISEISLASPTDVTSNPGNDNNAAKKNPMDWEDAEVSEEGGILILAKNPHHKEKESSEDYRAISSGEGSALNNSSIATSVKHFFEQTREDEDKSDFTENCLSLSNDKLLGSVVSWSVSAVNRDEILDFSTIGANHRSKIQYGRVLAASLSNSKALVRTMTSSDALIHLPLQMRASINIDNVNDGENIKWVPLKQLKLIYSEPNTSANEVPIGAPPREMKRSTSTNDSLNQHQVKHIKNTESRKGKSYSLDGEWKRDPNDRSSTMSKTPSVADALKKSLAKLTGGRSSGIYQAERILNDRTVQLGGRASKKYLIKWEGVNEITWEPEDHIFDTNLLDEYHEKKKIKLLEKNFSKADDLKSKGKYKSVKNIYCPFCGARCKDGQSLGGHIRMHRSEPNYKEILNSGKFLTSPPNLKDKDKNNGICVEVAVSSSASPLVHIAKEFKCHFCGEICKDGLSYGGHVRKHINEPNYRETLDAAKLDRDKAYEKLINEAS